MPISASSGPSIPSASDSYDDPYNWNYSDIARPSYTALAIVAVFAAGVQAQVLLSSMSETSPAMQVANTLFFIGLLSDVFGAVLSLVAARWFQMLASTEVHYLHERFVAKKGRDAERPSMSFNDIWMAYSIRITTYVVLLGIFSFVAGLMVLIWAQQPLAVRVICTVFCITLLVFLPASYFRHSRLNVASRIHLTRRSGPAEKPADSDGGDEV
ncbi:hypothetical protein M405DRAFT_937641 [Rhizopogon salebrosus TDB-379]|nr:hypothetical protein M405DRAFT_937641 [Rhizopogon salebrosus TDB-379]